MTRRALLLLAAELSLLFNVAILLSVSLNFEWVRTRAAGGQFESFPLGIRLIYFVMAALMGLLIYWLWNHRDGVLQRRSKRLARFLSYTFMVSTALQLISRSVDERWNAIPASILATTFWVLSRRDSY